MQTVLITGAGGFLGEALADAFGRVGWNVVRSGRGPAPEGAHQWRRFDLADASLPDGFFHDVDVLVHGAFVRVVDDPQSYSVNVEGSKVLIEAARAAGARVVFVSSLAAHAGARSEYGRQKRAIESLLDPAHDVIVQPGLILGEGGVFGRILRHVRSGRPIPLVDGGRQPLQTIHREDLVAALQRLVTDQAAGRFVLAETPAVPYRAFFRALVDRLGTHNRFVSAPSRLLLIVIALARMLRVRVPVDSDNVYGLMEMRFADPAANPPIPLPYLRSYAESLADLFGAP